MSSPVILLVTVVKLFFIPLYHSTDFEVHRNWLAITYNISIENWYYESTSEWTLDYPPLFAWLEYGLSYVAVWFDPKMLDVNNLNYKSDMTILFLRLSVIALDFVYIVGAVSCVKLLSDVKSQLLVFLLFIICPALLMVDHIHFQYNGFLYGIFLFSICEIVNCNYLLAAFWFAVLLNLKHIFLYVAPVYIVYLLRVYCFSVTTTDGVSTAWYSFSIANLFKLGLTVITVFGFSFTPFIDHLPQVLSRLFPFKRGLCHAYWAPNFWALYNFADKLLYHMFIKHGLTSMKTEASMTGGLVQEYEHAVLPSIKPSVTFVLTCLSMAPALVKLWWLCADRRCRNVNFLRCIVICATCSFMFGWHVHEKAILLVLLPMTLLSVLGETDGRLFLILTTTGNYSIFPLLYPKYLLPIKLFMVLVYCSIAYDNVPSFSENPMKAKRRGFLLLPMLGQIESFYIYGFLLLCFYENVLHGAWGLDKTLPFLPLMMTSVYCSIGVLYFWLSYYYYFLTFNVNRLPTFATSGLEQYSRKQD